MYGIVKQKREFIDVHNGTRHDTGPTPRHTQWPRGTTERPEMAYSQWADLMGYDFKTSYANTEPVCRKYISVDVKDRPFDQVLTELLTPQGLCYRVQDGRVVLDRLKR